MLSSDVSAMAAEPGEPKYESLSDLCKDSGHHQSRDALSSCCSDSFDDENDSGDEKNNHDEGSEKGECTAGDAGLQPEPLETKVTEEIEEFIQGENQLVVANNETVPIRPLTVSDALPDLPLEIGDHVYQWRSFAGIPGVFQVSLAPFGLGHAYSKLWRLKGF